MINHEICVYVRDSEGSVLLVRIKEAISPASNIIYDCHRTSDRPVPLLHAYATDAVLLLVKCGVDFSMVDT